MNTRKLVLIESDENGKEVDCNIIAENKDLLDVHGRLGNYIKDRYLIDKKEREIYTSEQWNVIEIYGVPSLVGYWFKKVKVDECRGTSREFHHAELISDSKIFWDKFFKEPIEKQKYILRIFEPVNGEWQWEKGKFPYNPSSLQSCWDWVNKNAGVFRVVENDGSIRSEIYIENKPTLKQVRYQNSKGRRVVFYSFKDWKIYATNENDFK